MQDQDGDLGNKRQLRVRDKTTGRVPHKIPTHRIGRDKQAGTLTDKANSQSTGRLEAIGGTTERERDSEERGNQGNSVSNSAPDLSPKQVSEKKHRFNPIGTEHSAGKTESLLARIKRKFSPIKDSDESQGRKKPQLVSPETILKSVTIEDDLTSAPGGKDLENTTNITESAQHTGDTGEISEEEDTTTYEDANINTPDDNNTDNDINSDSDNDNSGNDHNRDSNNDTAENIADRTSEDDTVENSGASDSDRSDNGVRTDVTVVARDDTLTVAEFDITNTLTLSVDIKKKR